MKKKVFGKKLGRERDSRRALFRSLIKALVDHGKIVTTKPKAKAILPSVERLVSKAKTNDVNSRKQVYSFLGNDRKTADMLFGQISKDLSAKKSGFVRITNLPRRKGDNAEMVSIEWSEKMTVVEKPSEDKSKSKKTEVKKEEKKVKKDLKTRVSKIIPGKKKK